MATLGVIEQLLPDNGDTAQTVRDHFTAIKNSFDYFVTQGAMSAIASNDGSGGTGFDFSDGANPSGHDAWAVYRMDNATIPYYILIQWNFASGYGANGGGLASGASSFGVGCTIAMSSDASTPWNGSTNFNGADTKGTPVWVPNTGNLLAFPRSNSVDGSFATNRQRLMNIGDAGTDTATRVHVITDEDSLIILSDHSNDSSYAAMVFSRYTARTGLVFPNGDCKYVALNKMSGLPNQAVQDYGAAVGTDGTRDGGVTGSDSADGVKTCRFEWLSDFLNNTHQPNVNVDAGAEFDEVDIFVYRNDALGGGFRGLLGTVDFIRHVAGNIATHTTNSGLTRAVFGSATANSLKLTCPWDGTTTPGSGVTRAGIQFNIP
jgi:hypothetical protein